eukprot:10784797-Karenia_brevis.AAC.1
MQLEFKEDMKDKAVLVKAQELIKETVAHWDTIKLPWQQIHQEIPHCKVTKMYSQSQKRLEVVCPMLLHLRKEELFDIPKDKRTPTWSWAMICQHLLPSIK